MLKPYTLLKSKTPNHKPVLILKPTLYNSRLVQRTDALVALSTELRDWRDVVAGGVRFCRLARVEI